MVYALSLSLTTLFDIGPIIKYFHFLCGKTHSQESKMPNIKWLVRGRAKLSDSTAWALNEELILVYKDLNATY